MGVPTIDTSTWRLPRKAHSKPEATFTDEMYRAKGLPVDPDRLPTTGGSGLPTVDTREWVTPSTRAKALAESSGVKPGDVIVDDQGREYEILAKLGEAPVRQHHKTFEVELDDEEFDDLGDEYDPEDFAGLEGDDEDMDEWVMREVKTCPGSFLRKRVRIRKGQGEGPPRAADNDAVGEAALAGWDASEQAASKALLDLVAQMEADPYYRKEQPVTDLAYIRKLKNVTRMMGKHHKAQANVLSITRLLQTHMLGKTTAGVNPKQWAHSVGQLRLLAKHGVPWEVEDVESPLSIQRRLAGLVESKHLQFATGTPHRRLPEQALPSWAREELTEGIGSYYMQKFQNEDTIYFLWTETQKNGNPKGYQVSWYIDKRSPTKAKLISVRNMSLWKPIAEKDLPAPVAKKFKAATEAFELPHDQAALAGLTERAPLPHPMHDTRPLQTPRAHGILDDGADSGEAYIEKVLQESRWFFRDFGDLAIGERPFDEAPGGRRGPWSGSDDEPAPTPIVRKGKVHGAVGQGKSPEERGEVDVGKSEIDYDHEPGEDEDEPEEAPPPKSKKGVKAKATPPEEEEPEQAEEGLEFAERDGDGTRAGRGARALGHGLKALGARMRHGSAAQKAKEGLHKRLYKFAAKHGLKAFGHTPDKPEKKAGAKPGVPKAPPKAPGKGTKPKPKPFTPHGPLHKSGGLAGPKMKGQK